MKTHTQNKKEHKQKKSNKKRGGKSKRIHNNKTKKRGGDCGCGKKPMYGGNPVVSEYAVIPLNNYTSNLLPKSSSFIGGKKRKQNKGGGIVDILTGLNPFSIVAASPNPITGLPDNLSQQKYVDSSIYKQPVSSQRNFLV
jgi:hypothetical protein